mmetsp:Transcript_62667/g.56499  ORF Transcript_62667/g.56499 Transcript_62667/m.56499 type:complete len:194 (+) Transcript_62667:31-612(+)|eukprot:CAMPEP_0201572030 /NCGR_PEP_ID=MMETSP0190_2-20130828/15080_1 /ASSEMBLY_ACC=CAM_ASM_000263 /TAXON_ID=37353 /ORGANISM="Rosalina sp." /LENGTH=193 /DNA_ID=CAMNT_0047997309 /DNA_START=31 /DNA_END=612 /DNA_ORIENTATION=+
MAGKAEILDEVLNAKKAVGSIRGKNQPIKWAVLIINTIKVAGGDDEAKEVEHRQIAVESWHGGNQQDIEDEKARNEARAKVAKEDKTPLSSLKAALPDKECRYFLYCGDTYALSKWKKDELNLIFWSPLMCVDKKMKSQYAAYLQNAALDLNLGHKTFQERNDYDNNDDFAIFDKTAKIWTEDDDDEDSGISD